MPNPFKTILRVVGTVLKGKLTVVGVITSVVGAVSAAVFSSGDTGTTSIVTDSTRVLGDTLTAVVDTVTVSVVQNNNPFASIQILVALCKEAYPHILVILGSLTTIAGFFRKAGAIGAKTTL